MQLARPARFEGWRVKKKRKGEAHWWLEVVSIERKRKSFARAYIEQKKKERERERRKRESEITNESTTCSHGFKTYVWKHTPVYHPAQLSLWQPLPSLSYVLALFHHCQLHVFASSGRQPSRDWILVNSLLFRLYDGWNKGPRGRRFSSSLAYYSLPRIARAINRSAAHDAADIASFRSNSGIDASREFARSFFKDETRPD